jgi:hypothetical protein
MASFSIILDDSPEAGLFVVEVLLSTNLLIVVDVYHGVSASEGSLPVYALVDLLRFLYVLQEVQLTLRSVPGTVALGMTPRHEPPRRDGDGVHLDSPVNVIQAVRMKIHVCLVLDDEH